MTMTAVAAAPIGCKRPKPKIYAVGQPCDVEAEEKCMGRLEVLVCVDGKYEPMPCRAVGGCKSSAGMGDLCKNSTFEPGEYCDVWMAVDDFWKRGCSVDGRSQLRCVGKHWQVDKPCPGKYGCRWGDKPIVGRRGATEPVLRCDEVITDKGTACKSDGKHACAPDFKTSVRCADGTWQDDQFCRGPEGCKETDGQVQCDDTLAEVGDPCADDGVHACSTDNKARLVCKSKKMVVDTRCKTACSVVKDKVTRGKAGPTFECD